MTSLRPVTFYDPLTGRIVGMRFTVEDPIISPPGLTYLDGAEAVLDIHYVDIRQSPPCLVKFPERPSRDHEFDYQRRVWVLDTERLARRVRAERDRLLTESDWTQLPDIPEATKLKWQEYRQALRDITQQPDPFNIVWPAAPG